MKIHRKLGAILLAGAICSTGLVSSGRAETETYEAKAGAIAADVLIYRPASLILTVGGAALFLVALPATLIAGGTKSVAKTLVATPFEMTFCRPVGTDLSDYTDE